LTKCQRRHIEEAKEIKLRRESGGNSSRKEVPRVFIEFSEQDSFQEEMNDSRSSDLGELRGG